MDEVQKRLSKCFTTVFPMLGSTRVSAASADKLAEWDSVAHLTLLAIIGEEFGVELDLETFQEKTSFQAIDSYLHTLVNNG